MGSITYTNEELAAAELLLFVFPSKQCLLNCYSPYTDTHTIKNKNLPFYFKLYLQGNTIIFSLILYNASKTLFRGRIFIKIPSFSYRDTMMYLILFAILLP